MYWISESINSEIYSNPSHESLISLAHLYQNLSEPFKQVYIRSKSLSTIDFTTVSLPGMCIDGIYFSTENKILVNFEDEGQHFFNYIKGSDKCMIFAANGNQSIHAKLETPNFDSTINIYRNFTDYTVLNTNDTINVSQSDSNSSIFVRLLIDNLTTPNKLEIFFNSDADNYYEQRNDFQLPQYDSQICEFGKLSSKKLGIALLIIISILVICNLYMCSLICKSKKAEEEFIDLDDVNESSIVSITQVSTNSKFTLSRFSNNDLIFFPQ